MNKTSGVCRDEKLIVYRSQLSEVTGAGGSGGGRGRGAGGHQKGCMPIASCGCEHPRQSVFSTAGRLHGQQTDPERQRRTLTSETVPPVRLLISYAASGRPGALESKAEANVCLMIITPSAPKPFISPAEGFDSPPRLNGGFKISASPSSAVPVLGRLSSSPVITSGWCRSLARRRATSPPALRTRGHGRTLGSMETLDFTQQRLNDSLVESDPSSPAM